MSGRHMDPDPVQTAGASLAIQVTQHYRELLGGTALDVRAAIEHGSAAARQLLLARAKIRSSDSTPFDELLEEITGKRKTRESAPSVEVAPAHGTASQRLGMLLLTGALLHSGAGRWSTG